MLEICGQLANVTDKLFAVFLIPLVAFHHRLLEKLAPFSWSFNTSYDVLMSNSLRHVSLQKGSPELHSSVFQFSPYSLKLRSVVQCTEAISRPTQIFCL